MRTLQSKILRPEQLEDQLAAWRAAEERIVFTNGCFDILHAGHVTYLEQARLMGQRLLVGLNSDASVGRLKGEGRPLQPFEHRAYMLAALEAVDGVVSFDEDTPLELIKQVLPEVLVKGEDYDMSEIVGASEVLAAGGEVRNLPLVEGVSTSRVIERVRQLPDKQTTTE